MKSSIQNITRQKIKGWSASSAMSLVEPKDELLAQSDVVVDCTPKKVAAINKGVYEAAGIKAIFHGGESHALTGHSFVAQANYASALGRSPWNGPVTVNASGEWIW